MKGDKPAWLVMWHLVQMLNALGVDVSNMLEYNWYCGAFVPSAKMNVVIEDVMRDESAER